MKQEQKEPKSTDKTIDLCLELDDLRHNLERGRKMGCRPLVEKHEAAIDIFKSIES